MNRQQRERERDEEQDDLEESNIGQNCSNYYYYYYYSILTAKKGDEDIKTGDVVVVTGMYRLRLAIYSQCLAIQKFLSLSLKI